MAGSATVTGIQHYTHGIGQPNAEADPEQAPLTIVNGALVDGAGNALVDSTPANATYIMGDSLASNGYITTGDTFITLPSEGAFNWANDLLGAPFVITGNTSAGGKTAQNITDEQIPVIAALTRSARPKYAFVSMGHNDLYADALSAAVCYARMVAVIEGLLALGVVPIWSTVWARSYSVLPALQHIQLNDMLRRYAYTQKMALFYDGFEASADQTTSTTNEGRLPLSTFYYDSSIHVNNLGALQIGRYMAAKLRPRIPLAAQGFVTAQEDQTFSGGTSNLLANPAFRGTGGTVSVNCTGTMPDSWTIDWATRTGSASAAAAIVDVTDADSGLVIGRAVQVTISGSPALGDIVRISQSTGFNSLLSAGSVVQAEGIHQLDTAGSISAFAMRVQTNTTESTWAGNVVQAVSTVGLAAFGPAARRTRQMTVLGSGAAAQARYDLRVAFNGTTSGAVFRTWKPRVRKVS